MKSFAWIWLIVLVFCSSFGLVQIDKSAFYEAVSGKSEERVDKEILKLEQEEKSSLVTAYLGAMLMRKADFEKGAPKKLKTFKKGAGLLDNEIQTNPKNAEFRFLRLIIQENAPKVLGYRKNIKEDKKVIAAEFDKLNSGLKKIIRNYADKSEVLKTAEFK